MTISSTTNRVSFAGNGVTVAFATSPVVFFDSADLTVYEVVTATGASTLKTLTTDYTVTGGSGTTGTVTMLVAPATGTTLLIVRDVAITQGSDLVNNDASDAEVIEDAFDRLTMITQQLDARVDRSFRLADSDVTGVDVELPDADTRALTVMGFDSDGDFTLYDPSSAVTDDINVAVQSTVTGGSARTQHAKNAERYDARDTGTSTSASVALQTTKLQAALDGLSSGQIIHIDEAYTVTALTLTNKTNVKIRGSGSITLSGAAAAAMCLQLVGTLDRIEIQGLKFAGESNAAYTQQGIGNASGQTISRVTVADCTFENLNSGPGFNADSGGTYSRVICTRNFIKNIYGTSGGQGYGIFASKVSDIEISHNKIENCERHSIYYARGSAAADMGVLIDNNTIRGHRSTINGVIYRPAIYFTRSYGGTISNNKIIDFYDGAIGVSQDTSDGTSVGDVEIIGNTFSGRKNAVSTLLIGEASNPTSYRASNIKIASNKFRADIAVGGIQSEITMPNGLNISVTNNDFHIDNLTETIFRLITVGENCPLGSKDLDNVVIKNNEVTGTIAPLFDASAVPFRFVRLPSGPGGTNNLTLNTGYKWTASSSGTTEFYMELTAGGNPIVPQPFEVYDTGVRFTKGGTLGALAASSWGYGDNDTLGYSTIYVRRAAGGDPDAATMTGDFPPRLTVVDNNLNQDFAVTNIDYAGTKTNKRITERFSNDTIPGVFTDADVNPSVYGGANFLQVANTGATNLAGLRDLTPGQRVTFAFSDANTTVKHNTAGSTPFRLIGGADITSAVRKMLVVQHNVAAGAFFEIAVAANS